MFKKKSHLDTNIYNQNLFNNFDLWQNYDKANEIRKKITIINQLLPANLNSIIDIGCGNGIITNSLSHDYNIIGTDFSFEALHFVTCKKFQCSADKMAVKDQTFNMVFSSELIEHLPMEMLINSVNEFKRITQKYLLITVPNNEYLMQNYVKCPACHGIFHSYGHLNTFTEKSLIELVGKDFIHIKTEYHGPKIRRYNKILLNLKTKVANIWFQPGENTICPLCGNREFEYVEGNLLSKACNALNRIFSQKKPYWLFIIFEKK